MSYHYSETRTVNSRPKFQRNRFTSLFGLLLVFISFYITIANRFRVDLSQLAETAIVIPSNTVNNEAKGKLVSITGNITSDELLGDRLYLKAGNYIFADRFVEMYSWTESSRSETRENSDGTETEETTYTYDKVWVQSPSNSSYFKYPQHRNPTKSLDSQLYKVSTAKVGVYSLDMQPFGGGTLQSKWQSGDSWRNDFVDRILLPLSSENINTSDRLTLHNEYVLIGSRSFNNPEIGDLRVSYFVLPANSVVTVFGKLESSGGLTVYKNWNSQLYRLILGNRKQAIATLRQEHKSSGLALTILSFLFMSIGLWLSPLRINAISAGGEAREGLYFANSAAAAYIICTAMVLWLNNLAIATIVLVLLFSYSKIRPRSRKNWFG